MKKFKFYKKLLIEILETLCSICLYLDFEGRHYHNFAAQSMRSHYTELKNFSEQLRGVKNDKMSKMW